jgi:hypothetical protein
MTANYQIAIPSYKRPHIVTTQTLQTLLGLGNDLSNVTIFTANNEETAIYKTATQAVGYDVNIQTGVPGLVNVRQWYNTNYYDKGTRILNIDDDIAGLFQKADNKYKPLETPLDDFVNKAFEVCEQYDARLWGINGVLNGLFMKDTITVGLRYIIGCFHGTYAGDPALCGEDRVQESSGEDFETTLRNYTMYGKVVRFDGIAPKTKYFAKGGIQAEIGKGKEGRDLEHGEALTRIAERYPDLAKVYEKAGGVKNIRLKNLTEEKINFP